MTASELKSDLLNKVNLLDYEQLKQVYGLIQNHLNSFYDETSEFKSMTPEQRKRIEMGINQAESGQTKPLNEAIDAIERKHSLHG